jgi:hypothetical protein
MTAKRLQGNFNFNVRRKKRQWRRLPLQRKLHNLGNKTYSKEVGAPNATATRTATNAPANVLSARL